VRQGDAGQRRACPPEFQGADGATAGVGSRAWASVLLAVEGDEGVEAGVEAVDAIEEQRRQFDRRNLPCRQCSGKLAQGRN
jgi:hypothetical protein